MATAEDIERAIAIFHDRRRWVGRRHSRIHQNALNDNACRESALKGLCGKCSNCKIQFAKDEGLPIAKVSCSAGRSPVRLYQFADWSKEVRCNKYKVDE